MFTGREEISAAQQIEVGLRVIAGYVFYNFLDADHLAVCKA
jgi:hypothetical protein